MRTFTAEKTSGGTSWGAVYAQWMQPVEDVKSATAGMTVERMFFKDGKRLSSLDHLKVGDRLTVRIVITADRDYDFVQITDKRAACLEPVNQKSGYQWGIGCYVSPRDHATNFYFDRLSKGKHIVEMEYYVDRKGDYQSGTCTAECTYSPEFGGRTETYELKVNN